MRVSSAILCKPPWQILRGRPTHRHRNSSFLQKERCFSLKNCIGTSWLYATSHRLLEVFWYGTGSAAHHVDLFVFGGQVHVLSEQRHLFQRSAGPYSLFLQTNVHYSEQVATRKIVNFLFTDGHVHPCYFIFFRLQGPFTWLWKGWKK